jgi:SAM-dependent methyltransferase
VVSHERARGRRILLGVLIAVCGSAIAAAQTIVLPFEDAQPVLAALSAMAPAELRVEDATALRARWSEWATRQDAETRVRIGRGDVDSVVNLLLFGTSFTTQPRITARRIQQVIESGTSAADVGSRLDAMTEDRLKDFLAALAEPGGDERLDFARRVLASRNLAFNTSAGLAASRRYLLDELARVLKESAIHVQTVEQARKEPTPGAEFAARSQLYRARGLSSDSSILPNFAIEEALKAMRLKGVLPTSIRRIAVIGPGLDFVDKQEGYDFYPPQTIQPFAVLDSLLRLGLVKADVVRLTTLDVSSRVNAHLDRVREKALGGESYTLQLPLDPDQEWTAAFLRYWTNLGDRIGVPAKPLTPPSNASAPRLRALSVRPGIAGLITAADVDVVFQRLELPGDQRFDIIVGTNIFLYYNEFQQALAMVNIDRMLRPGGILLSNNALPELPSSQLRFSGSTTVRYSAAEGSGDTVVWYRKAESKK